MTDYEKRLEVEIDRALKGLPELKASQHLSSRVMQAIARRSSVAWYRQAWPAWPPAIRFASLAILLIGFAGLCFAGWKASELEAVTSGVKQVNHFAAGIGALGHAVQVLLGTIVLLIKQLGTGVMIAIFATVALGYAVCLGLGTFSVRLAMARR